MPEPGGSGMTAISMRRVPGGAPLPPCLPLARLPGPLPPCLPLAKPPTLPPVPLPMLGRVVAAGWSRGI